MDITVINEFTFLCWLIGLLSMGTGLLYKWRPPQKQQWYHGIQLKIARRSEATWKATHPFAALPILSIGILFTLTGLLPFVFPKVSLFTFRSALLLMAIAFLLLKVLLEKHINSLFDVNGENKTTISL